MKFLINTSKIVLTLYIITCLLLVTQQFKTRLQYRKEFGNLQAQDATTGAKTRVDISEKTITQTDAKAATNSTNAPANNSTSPVSNSSKHADEEDLATAGSNVVGTQKDKAIIKDSPYKVKKCDEVLQFEAKTLDNLDNYKEQTSRFFTMSMYTINQFKEKKIFSFEKMVTLAGIQETPGIVTGSVSCLNFQSYYRSVYICMKDEKEAEEVLEAYKQFMRCRMGDNLKKSFEKPKEKMQNILNRACMGLDISFDNSKYKNPVEAEAALTLAINKTLKNLVDKTDSFVSTSLTQNVSIKPEKKIPTYQFH